MEASEGIVIVVGKEPRERQVDPHGTRSLDAGEVFVGNSEPADHAIACTGEQCATEVGEASRYGRRMHVERARNFVECSPLDEVHSQNGPVLERELRERLLDGELHGDAPHVRDVRELGRRYDLPAASRR